MWPYVHMLRLSSLLLSRLRSGLQPLLDKSTCILASVPSGP